MAFVCWQPLKLNEWILAPLRAALQHAPRLSDPDPDEPGPFAFADEDKVRRILEGAGFSDISLRPVELTLDIAASRGFEAALASACTIGPAARVLREASDAQREAAIAEIRAALTPFHDGAHVRLKAAPWLVEARE